MKIFEQSIFKNQPKSFLPKKQDSLKLFSVFLVGTNILAFLSFSYFMDGFVKRLTIIEILLVLIYVLSYALVESIFILVSFIILSIILPKAWLRDQLAIQGTLIYLIGTAFLYPWIGFTSRRGLHTFFVPGADLPQKNIIIPLWIFAFILIFYFTQKISKNESIRNRIMNILDRVSTLSLFYLGLDCLSFVIVVTRGLT